MDDVYQRLFPLPSAFSEADYLSFLSSRVPEDLAQQLARDAHPDLMLDEYVDVTDLMRPLSVQSFPANCNSGANDIFRVFCILEYALWGYARDITQNLNKSDPYKQIYIASFYLSCCLHGAKSCRGYVGALLVLVGAAAQTGLEGQLQVGRFIASLIPKVPGEEYVADPTPVSTALLALSLIVANTASDLSLLAEHVMHKEHFSQAWIKEEEESEEGDPSLDSMKVLRQIASAFFGVSGKVEQIADRFRRSEDWNKSSD